MPIQIMLTDDHSIIREGLKQLIELEGDMQVIAEASNGVECIEKLKEVKPDVLLLDINMPEMNGLEVLQHMKDNKMQMKTILLTVHNEVEYLMKAINAGMDGYILKDANYNELRKAILSVMNGETYIQPSLIPYLNEKIIEKGKDRQKIDELTNREVEVLKLMSTGLFNKEIGEQLSISERTVKNHISNIFRKLEVADRTQAAIFAIRNDIVKIS